MRVVGPRAGLMTAALFLGACASVVDELGSDRLPGPAAIDALVSAVALRFGPVELEPALRTARSRFARDSLAPSRLVDDALLWSRREGPRYGLDLVARGRLPYRVESRAYAPLPLAVGDYRGSIELQPQGSNDFTWTVRDELSIGRLRPERLARAWAALLAGLEGQTDAGLRGLIQKSLPRSRAAFGRLFVLEPILITPAAGGGAVVTLSMRAETAGIRAGFPNYAQFIDEYLTPARFSLVVTDEAGAPFVQVMAAEARTVLRLRVHDGRLGPLVGPPRGLSDRFRATTAGSVKSGPFRVGVDSLVSEVTVDRSKVELALRARFGREPDWQLPFVVKPLLRAPLRRPFEGEGVFVSLGAREVAGATLVEREYRLTVRESWIVRWLGRFGGGMVSAFRVGAEAEADRFMGECLWALRDDLVGVS